MATGSFRFPLKTIPRRLLLLWHIPKLPLPSIQPWCWILNCCFAGALQMQIPHPKDFPDLFSLEYAFSSVAGLKD